MSGLLIQRRFFSSSSRWSMVASTRGLPRKLPKEYLVTAKLVKGGKGSRARGGGSKKSAQKGDLAGVPTAERGAEQRKTVASGGRQGSVVRSVLGSDVPSALTRPYVVEEGNVHFETGRYARFADGAVLAKQAGSSVLATLVRAYNSEPNGDGVKLQTDYREKAAARGQIPVNQRRREMAQSDKETLTARIIDRGLRPIFNKNIYDDLQLTCTLMSTEGNADTDPLCINAASACLMTSNLPWNGPVGAIRVGMIDGELVGSPTANQLRESTLDLLYVGTEKGCMAIEAQASEISEQDFLTAISFAHKGIQPIIAAQKQLNKAMHVQKVNNTILPKADPFENRAFRKKAEDAFREAFTRASSRGKKSRSRFINMATKTVLKAIAAQHADVTEVAARIAVEEIARHVFRDMVLKEGIRIDGRKENDLRSIRAEVGTLEGDVHGSATFERGDTQVMATTTLGLPSEGQVTDPYLQQEKMKRFMLHYEFPPYCTGEIAALGRTSRREVGHGTLAEKAITTIVPTERDIVNPDEIFLSGQTSIVKQANQKPFHYVVRTNADVMGSDGSSSMATVCAASLALMDAGVPLAHHVAGISVGLVTSEEDQKKKKSVLLLDILGIEDHYGDMDFKVGGTKKGITAVQLDVKLSDGLPLPLIPDSLQKAKKGRLEILNVMDSALKKPRTTMSHSAPRMMTMKTEPLMRPLLMKNNREMLTRITDATGVVFQFEETGDLHMFAPSEPALTTARRLLMDLVGDVDVGAEYAGEVVRVADYGVFVEVRPGRQGLLHVSDIISEKTSVGTEIEAALPKVGDKVQVRVMEYDKQRGLIRLTMN